MPTTSTCVPSGNGGFSGASSTKCRSGTAIGSCRPGSALSASTMRVLLERKKLMGGG
jgi:hypothetical protein